MPCGLRGGGGRTDIPNSVDPSAETSVRSSTMWPPTESMSTCALHLVRTDGAPSVVLRFADLAPRARCPRQFQQLCRVKVSGPQFGAKTQNSRVVSKANSEKGISRFESCRPSHASNVVPDRSCGAATTSTYNEPGTSNGPASITVLSILAGWGGSLIPR